MISRIEKVEISELSYPFATAVSKCGLKENGYVEEEYFVTGTANVYQRKGQGKDIRVADVPYVNRILVRKPEDLNKFSGNIIVEILNSSSYFDVDRIWSLNASYMMSKGDLYVGIMSKPNVIRTLLKFDQKRYSRLKWDNPLKYDIPDEKLGNLAGHSHKETEDGLFWDMLIDLSKLLKRDLPENPIREYLDKKVYMYLAGWSQSGGYMIRYIRDFAQYEGKDVFDGYYSCGSVSLCTPNLNQEDLTDILSQDRTLVGLDKPFIDMHTESDNVKWGNAEARINENSFYRVYDIVGPSHDTTTTMEEYYDGDLDLEKIGAAMQYRGVEPYANGFPYEYAYRAALDLLYNWVRDGKEPMYVEPIKVDEKLLNVKDEDGNSIGGWRLPMITYPVCKYMDHCTASCPEAEFGCSLYGYEEPYDVEVLVEKYGTLKHYEELIATETQRCIEKGLLLTEDKEKYIGRAVLTAEKYGLAD